VQAEMDAGYRGLHRDHPGQVSVPPKKPAKDAAPELTQAWDQARHAQSSARICVEHAIADSQELAAPCNAGPAAASTCPRPSRRSAHSYPTAPPPGNRASPANRMTTPPEDTPNLIEHHVVIVPSWQSGCRDLFDDNYRAETVTFLRASICMGGERRAPSTPLPAGAEMIVTFRVTARSRAATRSPRPISRGTAGATVTVLP
jgi:hypothetical protein